MHSPSAATFDIIKASIAPGGDRLITVDKAMDLLAIEQPLEIRILYGPENNRQQKNISVTMCTPGNNEDLAAGFLFTEGIIRSRDSIRKYFSPGVNIIVTDLAPTVEFNLEKLERHFYTSSSCGVCGKTSIDAVKNVFPHGEKKDTIIIDAAILPRLPDTLRKQQEVFEHTGGLHASALFDLNGNLLLTREDVGRHNALDKLVGAALMNDNVPLDKHILLLSGRASFELIQKAAMAGIKIVCAVGAPSSLAVELAKETDMTLVGFLRDGRFNIYSGEQRIV